MLRIGQFCDSFIPVVDGVGRVVQAYAETLCAMGHQVTVSAPMYDTGYRGGYPFELVDFDAMTVPGVKQYRTGAATMDAHYRRRMEMIKLDIIHAHSPFAAGSEALRVARRQNIPIVCTFHSKFYDDFYKVTKSETLAQLGVRYVVNFMKRCNEVWAVSDTTATVLREYGYQGNIRTMPNGVKLRVIEPGADMKAEKRFGLGDKPLLLFVGQMDWKKNILRILEASVILKNKGYSFRLALAGQGPDKEAIMDKTVELGIDDIVFFTGHLTDTAILDGLYKRASLLTFPSLYDNAPMVVREAAVMGTPSVLVAGSSAAEIISDGDNGFLCRNDSVDLCRVIEKAILDKEKLSLVGERARLTIPVPWEGIMSDVVERYESIIGSYTGSKINKTYRKEQRLAKKEQKDKNEKKDRRISIDKE